MFTYSKVSEQPGLVSGTMTTSQNLKTSNSMNNTTPTKSAADNWKVLKRRVISYIRMQRMAENLVGIKE